MAELNDDFMEFQDLVKAGNEALAVATAENMAAEKALAIALAEVGVRFRVRIRSRV
jgi:hypothetical protein